ncbi:MAG: SRPBCC domain-containing protein [Planctomycetota bacterium]
MSASPNLGAHTVALEIPIQASRENVWRALVDETGNWWREDFLVTKGDNRRFQLEPHVGGRLYEETDSGAGLLWFTVTAIEPQKSLNLAGHIAPPWGGPATSQLSFQLEDHDGGTLVKFHDYLFGVVSEAMQQAMTDGWKLLLEDGWKSYAER